MKFAAAVSVALLSFAITSAQASDQVGTITQMEGTVKLFTNPSKSLESHEMDLKGNSPRALFEGEYFRVHDAKVGDRVEFGNILRTAPQSKARVVFDNGDQYNVGPGTAYRVFWNRDQANSETKIELMYGKLRGVVAKGGPRSRLLIRTKSATMGVRGTDFFIASGLSEENGVRTEETEVSIVRGAVEVASRPVGRAPVKVVQVRSGYSAEVSYPVDAGKETVANPATTTPEKHATLVPKVELRKTTQEDLTGIQKSSELQAKIMDAPKQVRDLESKAVQTAIEDCKTYDPKLYAQLQGNIYKSTDEVNHVIVEKMRLDAPKAALKRKPFKSEMEDLEGGSYDKYFKPATEGSTGTGAGAGTNSQPAH